MNKNFFHVDNLTYFDEENIYPECVCNFEHTPQCDLNNTNQNKQNSSNFTMNLFDIHLNCKHFIMGHCFLEFGDYCPYQSI